MMSCPPSFAAFPRSLPRPSPSFPFPRPSKKLRLQPNSPPPKKPRIRISSSRIGVEQIAEIAHNKVFVAAILAAAVGQFSKPLTAAIQGKGIDLKAAARSGGMPSAHSAGVVAAATTLGLERGFSDSIFGISVVFAGIVLYDAQAVRKEVGYHAEILNRMLEVEENSTLRREEADIYDSKPGNPSINSEEIAPLITISQKANSYGSTSESYSFATSGIRSRKLRTRPSLKADATDPSEKIYSEHKPLNESVGHTRIQVLVGALLGFIASLTIDNLF